MTSFLHRRFFFISRRIEISNWNLVGMWIYFEKILKKISDSFWPFLDKKIKINSFMYKLILVIIRVRL